MTQPKILLVLLLSGSLAACRADAPPTLTAADIAATAMEIAWTQVALTEAARPSATPLPPTLTPAVTPTLFPTLAVLLSPVPPGTPTLDLCSQPAPSEPLGKTTHVTFVNKSGGQVNLAFGMESPNDKGECGTYSFSLSVYERPTASVLTGCYWAYGWITKNPPSTAESIKSLCLTDAGTAYTVEIGTEVIDLK